MKAWRLNNLVLEIYDIDDSTREMRKMIPLKLKEPMTHSEAQHYVDANYPDLRHAKV